LKPLNEYKPFKLAGAHEMFPNEPHLRGEYANSLFRKILDGRPFPKYLSTIQATMEEIFKLRGVKINREMSANDLNLVMGILMQVIEKKM